MSTVAALADRLRSGSPAFTAWCGMPEPAIAGLLAREAFDAVTLDMQHGAIDLAATLRAIPLIAGGRKAGDRPHPGRRVRDRLEAARCRRLGRHRADDQHRSRTRGGSAAS